MVATQPLANETENTRYGKCPSCGVENSFKFVGVQVWPEAVAKRLKTPQRINLYQCPNCRTTISEMYLIDPDTGK